MKTLVVLAMHLVVKLSYRCYTLMIMEMRKVEDVKGEPYVILDATEAFQSLSKRGRQRSHKISSPAALQKVFYRIVDQQTFPIHCDEFCLKYRNKTL